MRCWILMDRPRANLDLFFRHSTENYVYFLVESVVFFFFEVSLIQVIVFCCFNLTLCILKTAQASVRLIACFISFLVNFLDWLVHFVLLCMLEIKFNFFVINVSIHVTELFGFVYHREVLNCQLVFLELSYILLLLRSEVSNLSQSSFQIHLSFMLLKRAFSVIDNLLKLFRILLAHRFQILKLLLNLREGMRI